ncbi:MAG: stimulus-sensing domain-containing protein [Proteobacteria bacterium]|nr:stimulus-sensing domain-containing protein [Pseudomonadota bacterium]MDA1058751.1 stimulus-sensing domain-containing protein [Pseudomonadota bacterium]
MTSFRRQSGSRLQENGAAVVPGERPQTSRHATVRSRRLGSITARILTLNLLAFMLLVFGLFYVDEFGDGLVEAKIQSLKTEGEIIAGALGESALNQEPPGPVLDPATTRQLLRRLIEPTQERARVFDPAGALIADSRSLLEAGREVQFEILPPAADLSLIEETYEAANDLWRGVTGGPRLPPYVERGDQAAHDYQEVTRALAGEFGSDQRARNNGDVVLSVAIPIQSFKRVLGALMLTADTRDIDARVRDFRLAILQVSGVALAITVLLSLYLARTIATPVKRLAAAAERVRGMQGRVVEIPDFTDRADEIGELSGALRDMTSTLYKRLDAIETFAADVAHEIKNPLTSLRSAVEALDKARDESQRLQLLEIIRDDVGRIDRLLSDISDASRLDAELSRTQMAPVNLRRLLETIVEVHEATGEPGGVSVVLDIPNDGPFFVLGIEDRLGQVMRNVVDNARSFSPPHSAISLSLARVGNALRIACDDEGPGFPSQQMDRVFERFYTRRPDGEAFGKHSGLGLSISRQIIEAHHGKISATNRSGEDGTERGARVTIELPALNTPVDSS